MNIDDVLLTNNEADLLWEEYCESNPTKPGWERMKRKAQCLKLLEWLKEECKGHDYKYNDQEGTYTEVPLGSLVFNGEGHDYKYNYQEGTYTEVPLGSLGFNGEDNTPAQMNRHMKFTLRQDCSWCMSELESKLKEAL